MSRFVARVEKIRCVDNLHIVEFVVGGQKLCMMSLELGSEVSLSKEVVLAVKPTHVALAKNLSGLLSYENIFKARVLSIENGTLLSSVLLSFEGAEIEAIVTRARTQMMELKVGEEVECLVQASELSIVEVRDV